MATVKMPFLNLVFEAEVCRSEDPDPDFEEMARRNCSEEPNTRDKLIQELRTMIKDRGEFKPRRMDDAYLIRFLRCRKFRPELAYRVMMRYENFHRDNPHLYACEPFTMHRFKNIFTGTVPENPVNGRIVFIKSSGWNPDEMSTIDLVRIALITNEIAIQQPRLQVLGFTVILDLKGFNLKHVRHLNTAFAYHMVSVLGVAFPINVHKFHIINYSRLFTPFYFLCKQFMLRHLWDRVYFHGSNTNALHRYIEPQFLPPEYGGTCGCMVKFEDWIVKIDYYKDDFLVHDLRDLGYTVK